MLKKFGLFLLSVSVGAAWAGTAGWVFSLPVYVMVAIAVAVSASVFAFFRHYLLSRRADETTRKVRVSYCVAILVGSAGVPAAVEVLSRQIECLETGQIIGLVFAMVYVASLTADAFLGIIHYKES